MADLPAGRAGRVSCLRTMAAALAVPEVPPPGWRRQAGGLAIIDRAGGPRSFSGPGCRRRPGAGSPAAARAATFTELRAFLLVQGAAATAGLRLSRGAVVPGRAEAM